MKHLLVAVLAASALAPAAMAGEINVSYSPDFAEKLSKEYGEREGTYLSERVKKDLETELARGGVDVARIDVTIVDATPSRPTFKQGSDTPGLDMHRSVSLGGMKLKAVAYDAAGNAGEAFEYKWYESDITQAGITTWHDARRASGRFASRFAKALD
ncbi:MAG TPA: hypothetical protein PKV67_08700 [Hyphomonas sp.]|nr:hypothetical protein [Hyphomonas sp.]HRK66834.1 hypothetical protein [Hyphomonas sp.]